MTKKILFILLFVSCTFGHAQRISILPPNSDGVRNGTGYTKGHLPCGTVADGNRPLKVNPGNHQFVDNGNPYVVNVFYHFIKGNTFGEQNPSQKAEDMTILLNENFNRHNVFIRNSGYDIINNESYVSTTTSEFRNKLVKVNKKGNAINIYINEKHNNKKNSGQANGIHSKAFLVISNATTTHTVPHELAHCLGLYHTYQKWNKITEPKDGSQCLSLGDFVCDSPPDKKRPPNTKQYTNPPSCTYTGADGYNPDVKNIMAPYYNCREHFTTGQGERMRYFLGTSTKLKPVLTSVEALLSPQKNTISSASHVNFPNTGEICDQSVRKLQFQKGFTYTIKYRDNPLKETMATFSPTQLPIIYTATNIPTKSIKIGIASLNGEHTYKLYRNCEPITRVSTVNLRNTRRSNRTETVSRYNERDYIGRLRSGTYQIRTSTRSGMTTRKKIRKNNRQR